MPRQNEVLKVGDSAPPFVLRDSEGAEVRLAEVWRSHVVVLVFLRGTW